MSKVQAKPTLPVARRMRKVSRTESECSRDGEDDRLTDDPECLSPPDEDVRSLCEYHELPAPPDGGYGWVIVFASFLCNMIVDGIAYSFGVFLNEFVAYYGSGKGTTAWVGSLLSGMYLLVGPVVSALTNRYGCRSVCIAGSIISCLSFVLSTYSPTVSVLMLTYGFLGGIGFGLIYLPAVVCVGYYFETKRSLATGIAVCGSGFGTFAFAPLANILIDTFGWKGANLIFAGLILNCAIFGALMRPLEFPKTPRQKPLLQRMAEEKRFQMERGSIGGSYFMVQLPDGTMEKRQKMPINIDPGVHSSFHLDQLSQVPGTPVTPIPTLPTISEVKGPDQGSSGGSSESGDARPPERERRKSRRIDEIKEEDARERGEARQDSVDREDPPPAAEFNKDKSSMPRNASQPAFTTHVSGLPKNGSVPFFDRIRKTSAGERYRPTLQAIKNSSRSNVTSNGDLRKAPHLKLSASSFGNNNCDDMWSKTDVDTESVNFASSKMSLQKERKELIRPLSRKDIFYSRSVVNLPEYQSQKSLAGYRQSVVSLPRYGTQAAMAMSQRDVETGPPPELCPCLSLPESFKSALNTMMDFSLLKDPVFLLIGISNVFGMAGLYVPFVYLVDAAVVEGIELNSASFLISIIGITNTVGRVACGYVADFPQVNSLLLNNICLVVSTVAVAATPFCTSYAAYVTMAIFFGLAVSGYISLTSIILVDLLGLEKLTNAFGLLILFRGAAAIVGSPLAGAVYDATQSYQISFLMAGGFFAVSAITSFLAPSMRRCVKVPVQMTSDPDDVLTPIDEDEEEDQEEDMANGGIVIPEITRTMASPSQPQAPSPAGPAPPPSREIEQLESVL